MQILDHLACYTMFHISNPTTIGENGIALLSFFDMGHYAYTPDVLFIPAFSLFVLIYRFITVKDNVLKYKFVLIALVYISVFYFYIVLVFGGSTKDSLNYMFSLATLYLIVVLYRISFINHVLGFRNTLKLLRRMFFEYVLFGIIVSAFFILFFLALPYNLVVFAILGSVTILLLYFAQALVRKKNQASFVRDTAEVTLGNFFTNIDYTGNKEKNLRSFTEMVEEVFDASGIEFFVVEEDELRIAHSSRDFYDVKLHLNTSLFKALSHTELTVLSRSDLENDKALFDIHEELENAFSYFNSHAMIVLHGERSIIGIISLGEKKLSIHYSDYDVELMRYFYPNFFVFGYYLQTSRKESLMGIISREIEFSGQVTNSIYKNIDKIHNPTLDVGYLSRSLRNLGGDFIDIIHLNDEKHMLVVGDVSGRGLNASMCMIILKSFIRSFVKETEDLIALISKLNSFIKHNLPRGIFFAGTFMIFDSSTNMLYYVNCGVPGIFLYTKSYNNVIEIQGEGKVLGFVENISELITVKEMQLHAGDIVLTCSDGVTDSLSLRGELYGKKRIENVLLENMLYPSQNICQFLYDDLQSFTAKGISDDVSVLLLKLLG